jgi:acetyltransferase EpsM
LELPKQREPAGTIPPFTFLSQLTLRGEPILNLKASVSHDCQIGDFVIINPAATLCGDVTVADGSFIGAGAVVKNKIKIGRGVTVGAGAVVIRDLPDGATAVGVPARVIKQNPVGWVGA